MKKVILLSVFIICLIAMFSVNVSADTFGDWEYTVNSDKICVTITKYNGTATELDIPSVINGYSVTSIGYRAFYNNKNITEVTIPNSVTSIENGVFQGCTSLGGITIPNSVTFIGNGAFYGCTNIKEMFIPKTLTSYSSAFNGSEITKVIIEEGAKSIPEYAFQGCAKLTDVTIPNSVTSINSRAFENCIGLIEFTISNSVKIIGHSAFNGCIELKEVRIPKTLTSYGDNVSVRSAFYGSGITKAIIEDGAISIPSYAFSGCANLTEVTMPNSIESIGGRAFSGCTRLTTITIPSSVTTIGDGAFYGCTRLTEIDIPNNVVSIGRNTFENCTGLTEIIIPNSVTSIGRRSFYGCTNIKEIFVPKTLTSYGENSVITGIGSAFTGSGIKKVIIEEGTTSIPYHGFYGCAELTEITIPNSVTSISDSAFSGCTGLTEITIPNSATSIGSSAFYGCTGLTEITIPNSVTSIGSSAFYGCTGLTEITIPQTVKTINNITFRDCSNLEKAYIPNTVTSISDTAFLMYGTGAPLPKLTIYGAVGSIANTYATKYSIPFIEFNVEDLDYEAPTAPTDFTIETTDEYIKLNWKKEIVEEDFKHFNVYRSIDNSQFSLIKSITSIGYFDDASTGVVNNVEYYYYVTSVDKFGNESDHTQTLSSKFIDSIKPQITNITPANSSDLVNNQTINVTVKDNLSVDTLKISYRLKNTVNWLEITEISVNKKSSQLQYIWNTNEITTGTYEIKYTITDTNNNSDEIIYTYNIYNYTGPQAPVLEGTSYDSYLKLSWTYSGDLSVVDNYKIYRSEINGDNFALIGSVKSLNYYDRVIGEYKYKVVVEDIYNNTNYSNIISLNNINNITDNEAPIAIISTNRSTIYENEEIEFSGIYSTDNGAINTYHWNFGDGATSNAIDPKHTYAIEGTYTVILTVSDNSGNSNSTSIDILVIDSNNKEYIKTKITVLDAITLEPISNAELLFVASDASEIRGCTDVNGYAEFVLFIDTYIVDSTADNYMPRRITMEVTSKYYELTTKYFEYTIGMSGGSLVTGELVVEEMTPTDIRDAGIDTSNPANEHIYKFKTVFEFIAAPTLKYKIPVTLYKNMDDEIVHSEGTGFFDLSQFTGGGGGGYGSGLNIGIFPISEHFWLVIYGEARWLKEMYKVELLVVNNSNIDSIIHCNAELILPDGLSLADRIHSSQRLKVDIGAINTNSSEVTTWYIRGDKAGEYYLSANVTGEFTPNKDTINLQFNTQTPIKVYAGDAFHLTITAPNMASRGDDYTVKYRLTNVSDKPIYNMDFKIDSIEQYKVFSNGINEVPSRLDNIDINEFERIGVMKPGDFIEVHVSCEIQFNSIWELITPIINSKLFISLLDVGYFLTDVMQYTLEGSSTEIPYTIIYEDVEKPDIFVAVSDVVNKLFGDSSMGNYLSLDLKSFINDFIKSNDETNGILPLIVNSCFNLMPGSTKGNVTFYVNDATYNSKTGMIETKSINIETRNPTILNVISDTVNETRFTADMSEIGSLKITAKAAGNEVIKIDTGTALYEIPIQIIESQNIFYNHSVVSGTQSGNGVLESYIDYALSIIEDNTVLLNSWAQSGISPFLNYKTTYEIIQDETNLSVDEYITRSITSSNELIKELYNNLINEIVFSNINGSIVIDENLIKQIITSNEDISVSMQKSENFDLLNSSQDNVDYKSLYNINIFNGEYLESFNGNEILIGLPYKLLNNELVDNLYAFYVDDNGNEIVIESFYDAIKEMLYFYTDHLSYYGIGYITDSDEEVGDFEYEIIDSELRTIKITKCNSDDEEIIIPAEIDGYTVVSIENDMFDENNNIKVIIFKGDAPEVLGGTLINISNVIIVYDKDNAGWDSSDWEDYTTIENEIYSEFIPVAKVELTNTGTLKQNNITLSAKINPNNATNKKVNFSISPLDDGSTNAVINNGNILYAANPGYVIIRVIVENGINYGLDDYVTDIKIEIKNNQWSIVSILEKLFAPIRVIFEKFIAFWESLFDNGSDVSYEVALYNNDKLITKVVTKETSYDFTDIIKSNGAGIYTIAITAIGDGINTANSDTVVSENSFTYNTTEINSSLSPTVIVPKNVIIKSSAGIGGGITPEGTLLVMCGFNMTFRIIPDEGYTIKTVLVDGKDMGSIKSYTFKDIDNHHTIHAEFEKTIDNAD